MDNVQNGDSYIRQITRWHAAEDCNPVHKRRPVEAAGEQLTLRKLKH
jgi:hypothetical protein